MIQVADRLMVNSAKKRVRISFFMSLLESEVAWYSVYGAHLVYLVAIA